jgi:hypothetical protein
LDKLGYSVLIENFSYSTSILLRKLEYYLFYKSIAVVCIIAAIYLLWRKRDILKQIIKEQASILWIVLIAFLWALLTMFLAPLKVLRYVLPIFPLIALFIPLLASYLDKTKRIFFFVICTFIYLIVAIRPNRIEFLYKGASESQVFNQSVEIPVIITLDCEYLYIIPYLADKQQYEFVGSNKNLTEDINKYNEVFVLISQEGEKTMAIPDNYKIKKSFKCGNEQVYFTGYLISNF